MEFPCYLFLQPMPDFKMRDPVIRPARDQLNRLQGKRDFSEVFLDKLRKVLDQLLCCLTLGCVRRGEEEEGILESELTDEEDSAIKLLLAYLNEGEPPLNCLLWFGLLSVHVFECTIFAFLRWGAVSTHH